MRSTTAATATRPSTTTTTAPTATLPSTTTTTARATPRTVITTTTRVSGTDRSPSGPDVAAPWILSSVGFFELLPGEPKQLLHRDAWKYGAPSLPGEVDLNGIWAITDFTAENGATHVVPEAIAARTTTRSGGPRSASTATTRPPSSSSKPARGARGSSRA